MAHRVVGRRRARVLFAAATVAVVSACQPAGAAELVWNPQSAAQHSWNLTSPSWRVFDGSTPTTWVNGSGTDFYASVSQTVTVDAAIELNSMWFRDPVGYVIAPGSGSLTFHAGSFGTPNIRGSASINVPLRGDGGMHLWDGTLNLNAASTYAGATTVSSTVRSGVSSVLPTTTTLTLFTGGALELQTFDQSLAAATIQSGASLVSSGGNLTVANELVNNGTLTFAARNDAFGSPVPMTGGVTTAHLSGNGTINLSNSAILTVDGDATIDTFSGNINPGSGSTNGSLFKRGTSMLILLGTSRLSGAFSAPAISVEGGALSGNTNNLVNTIAVNNGAQLQFVQPADGTFDGRLTGTGNVRFGVSSGSPATVTLTQASTFTGDITLSSAATLAASADTQLGRTTSGGTKPSTSYATLTFDGGTLRTLAGLTTGRPIRIGTRNGTIDTNGLNSAFSGPLTAVGQPTAVGDTSGSLRIIGGGGVTFGGAAHPTLHALIIDGTSTTLAASVTLTGAVVPSGKNAPVVENPFSLSMSGVSTLTLNAGAALASHDAFVGNAAAANSTVVVTASTWSLDGGLVLGKDSVILSPVTASAPGKGTLQLEALADVHVSGLVSLLGSSTIHVTSGTFAAGGLSGGAGTSVEVSSAHGVSTFTISGSAANATFSGAITGGGGLTKVGTNTQTLAGANTYLGTTFVNAGTLALTGSSTSSSTHVNAEAIYRNDGTLSGSVNVNDGGVLAGEGQISGTVSVHGGGRINPSGSGLVAKTLSVGSLTLDPGARTEIGLFASTNDMIAPAGSVMVGGTVAFLRDRSFVATLGRTIVAISSAPGQAYSGGFQGVSGFEVGGGLRIAPKQRATFVITYPGDADTNLAVNFDDLLALAKHYNAPGTWADGDFDYSGTVNFDDLLALAKNYNVGSPTGAVETLGPTFAADWALAQSLVPEPSLLTGGLGLMLAGRRRRRR